MVPPTPVSPTEIDRLERLTNLVLVLLNARHPLSLDTIAHEVPGYPEGHDSRRQAFERDKRLLRDEGIPVLAEPITDASQVGYRIDPEAFYLPDLDLTPDEQTALHLAVAGVHLGDPSGRHALAKLGATGVSDAWPLASMVPPPALVPLFEAVRVRAAVTFGYRGEPRQVAPAAVWFRRGRWYLVGWDLARDAARTFRVDRIDDVPSAGAAGSASLPEGFDAAAAVPDEPWRIGTDDEEETVVVRVDAIEGPRVAREVGGSGRVQMAEDGSVTVALPVTNRAALRSWVLGLLDHAVVESPPDARQAMVDWLRSAVEGPPDAPGAGEEAGVPPSGPRAAGSPTRPPAAAASARGPRSHGATSERLRRLLAIVGWLARVGEAPISEISERFGLSERELVAELELAACCGLPPYTPDVLMEIEVTETTVRTFLPEQLGRARRLTPSEGFAVAAAARTILAVPGADQAGALAGALAKLDAVLGDHGGLVVELEHPDLLEAVRSALAARQRIEIEYYSASSDELTTREVDPIRVVTLEGHWYLDADCRRAGDVRRFRVDRIRSVRVVGPAPDGGPDGDRGADSSADIDAGQGADTESSAFVPGPGARRVTLSLSPSATWLLDTVPVVERATDRDGATRVVLDVGGTAWLERLLLQLGGEAVVLEPDEFRHLAAKSAARVLARYTGT